MKIFAAYLLVSVALASGISEDASLRGASDDLAADVNVERDLKNACKNSDVKYNTYSGEKCFSKCACDACQERGGGLCCNASCNPQCDPKNPPCEDSRVHKWCYDKDLCSKCKKKGLCCTDVCDFYHCDKNLPPCSGACFGNIDNCQELVQCPLGCGTDCGNLATAGCHQCCRDKHPALGASKNACKNSDVKYNTYSGKKCFSKCACEACLERGGGICCNASCNPQCDPKNPPCEDSPSCEVDVRQSCKNECNQVYRNLPCSF